MCNSNDLGYLNGPWSNLACKGYAIQAMERLGYDREAIEKLSIVLEWCFDETGVEEAAQYFYNW